MSQPITFLKPVPKPHLRGKFCPTPFTDISIDEKGQFTMCKCQLHMPFVVGNINDITISQAWNSDIANSVRQSVINGTFDYCSWKCPKLNHLENIEDADTDIPASPKWINISNDRSCNLKCPSCRENVIIEKNQEIISRQKQIVNQIIELNQRVVVDPCSNGEPLVSPSTMHLLKNIDELGLSHVKLNLSTNGTLIYHYRELIKNLLPNILGFSLSIDAATKETYQQVRGDLWDDLILGLEWLKSLGVVLPSTARFVVQGKNYHEMKQFVEFARYYKFQYVHFQLLRDWGHWSDTWWADNTLSAAELYTVRSIVGELKSEFGDFVVVDNELLPK